MISFSNECNDVEVFIGQWNTAFPEHQIAVDDLSKSHSVIGALFHIFDQLGIDIDAVLMPPTEKNLNDHMIYYWDLNPIINVTRVINYFFSYTTTINHFLQPTTRTSHSILLFMFNLLFFHKQRFQPIAPAEDELLSFNKMVQDLEEKKQNLFEKLNSQAVEKGERDWRMEKMREEIQQLEEELRQEELACKQEKQELDPIMKENDMTDLLLDQKRATKEGLLADRERKKAMRVYDADDIRTQAAQAAQNVQEAEEKLNSLKEVIAQKENSLQILQMIKPNLDTANNLLHEIAKLKDSEYGDLDEESTEGELEVLKNNFVELQAQESEVSARLAEFNKKRRETQARQQTERATTESALREAEEKDKKRREFVLKATQRTQEIKQLTSQYDEQKAKGIETIKQMKKQYNNAIKAWEDALSKLVADVRADIDKKFVLED